MKGKGLMITGLFLGLIGLTSGIIALYKRQIYMAMQYCYKLSKVTIISFDKNAIKFDVYVKILNRSSFSLIIKNYSFDIYLNSSFITKIENDQEVAINPESSNLIRVPVSIDPKNILKGSLLVELVEDYLFDKSKINLQVKGNLTAKANFISIKKLPIDYKTNMKEMTAASDPKKESENLICPKDF